MLKPIKIIFIIISFASFLYAVNNPELPKDPSSGFVFNDPNSKIYHARIVCAGQQVKDGIIYLRIDKISFVYQRKIYSFSIGNLKTIEYIEWHEYKQKNKSYAFYPSKIMLTMKDNALFTIEALPMFNKVEFSDQNGKVNIYSYFYDYWEKKKWKNTNNSERNYPNTNPLAGTITRIEFTDTGK